MHNCQIRFKNLHNICWKVCMNIFVMLWILSLILNFFPQTKDFYLFKLVWIFVTDLLNILVLVFKDYLVCLSINFMIFIFNIIVLLCTLNSLTSLMNFSLSLKTFPWWYAMDIMFFFFVWIISSYCFITAATSLGFSSLSSLPAFNFKIVLKRVLLCMIKGCKSTLSPPFLQNYFSVQPYG